MDKNHPLDPAKGLKARFRGIALALLGAALLPNLAAAQTSHWTQELQQRLTAVDAAYPGELGVYVKDLRSGQAFSFRGEESWYLASGIKVPVAIGVMRGIERGDWSLDTRLELAPGDYVDGAGQTNWHPPGTELSISFLLEQMIIYSDNTASDRLIRLVGVAEVNRITRELVPEGFGEITTLADVRRHAYSAFHQSAFELSGPDFFALRQLSDERKRVDLLANILKVTASEFQTQDLDTAFETYYATNLNGGQLSAFARLLESLAGGEALAPESTEYLMGVLHRVKTGDRRIKAGLPAGMRFAHKTGTQRARTCDLGIASRSDEAGERQVVVAACTRGYLSVARSEQALREVGAALQASGVFTSRAEERI